ncbi:MAG: BadF/BadG/BcrA/BcrD ATPase family protein [Gemmatimonadales bacterium]
MIVLSADVGGTSMRVVLYSHGAERGRAEGRGEPMRASRGGALAAALAALARPLLSRAGAVRADAIVIGAAGAGGAAERAELEQAVDRERLAWQVLVVTDAQLARAAAFEGAPGVLLIAGTGSIALGLAEDGKHYRAGGLGWRMGDDGSGYWIGVEALKAVGRMHDGLGPSTRLAELLAGQAGVAGIGALIRWSTVAAVDEVAGLAPVVAAAAEGGDAVAGSIIEQAVGHLVELARAAGGEVLPVALSGGLLAPGRPLREAVTARLEASGQRVVGGTIDPCLGGPVLARGSRAD